MATKTFDLIVIGTGAAASTVAFQCQAAGWQVAIIDCRPFGGTCMLRGCDPKKVLVGAAALMDWIRRMEGKGVRGDKARIEWSELMRFKRTFTDPVPEEQEKSFANAGITPFHGTARFLSPTSVEVGAEVLEGHHIVIATGAKPQPLDIPGEQYLTTSDQFLELNSLPRRIVFVGGGYISFEFAHVSARAEVDVTVLHRADHPLEKFDPDLVEQLVERTRRLGVDVELQTEVKGISRKDDRFVVRASSKHEDREFQADMVVHGAGRVADIDELNLAAAGVRAGKLGVAVNEYLQSVSNPSVYAAGDSADTGLPKLTPVAMYEGGIVAENLVHGNQKKVEPIAVPTIAFTLPPVASVGLSERAAQEHGLRFRVHREKTATWYSSRRVAEDCSGFKVLIEETGRILGAHLLGPEADELINIFAFAIQAGMPAERLGKTIFAYPTHASDVAYML
jgi:glutathione reductase (NADPH)